MLVVSSGSLGAPPLWAPWGQRRLCDPHPTNLSSFIIDHPHPLPCSGHTGLFVLPKPKHIPSQTLCMCGSSSWDTGPTPLQVPPVSTSFCSMSLPHLGFPGDLSKAALHLHATPSLLTPQNTGGSVTPGRGLLALPPERPRGAWVVQQVIPKRFPNAPSHTGHRWYVSNLPSVPRPKGMLNSFLY